MSRKTDSARDSHVFERAEFTKEMKKTHKILAPDIFPIHMELIKNIFELTF